MKKMKTNQQLRLYYYDGIIANSKEEVQKRLIKEFTLYRYLQDYNQYVIKSYNNIRYIILNRKYKYLVSYQKYDPVSDALLTADELYKKANILFKYMGSKNGKGYITISKFTNRSKFAQIIRGFNNHARLKWKKK